MRTIPHHITICPCHTHGAIPREPSATEEPAASTSPYSSVGAAKERPLPPAFAAPVLIHHPSNTGAHGGGEAPSVLLLDGPSGTPFMWHRVLPVLRKRGVQPCTVKRPGNPATAGQAEDPFTTAADIAQLLDDQQRGPAAAPMLGPVVTWLGFRLAGLALYLPALRRGILTTRAGLNACDAKQFVRPITFGSTWRTFVSEQRRLVSDARRRKQQLSRIDSPVLIVDGTRDRIIGPRTGTALRRLLPGSEVITIGATGHLIPIDDPDSVADAVLRALRHEYRTSLSARPFKRQRPQAPIHGNRDQARTPLLLPADR